MANRPLHRKSAQNAKSPKRSGLKSSPEARRLIRAVMHSTPGKQRSLREVARRLKIKNHSRVQKILKGEIRDTPDMRAALKRQQKRADIAYRRAWRMIPAEEDQQTQIECMRDQLLKIRREVETALLCLKDDPRSNTKTHEEVEVLA